MSDEDVIERCRGLLGYRSARIERDGPDMRLIARFPGGDGSERVVASGRTERDLVSSARDRALSRRRVSGFSLLEVLVALVIMSIGMLGMARLQAAGLRGHHDAWVRTRANWLAYDIMDRMRANPDNADSYTAGDPGTSCGSGASLAQRDLSCWHEAIRDGLPGGSGSIAKVPGSDPPRYQVVISWADRGTGATVNQSWLLVVSK